MLQSVSPGKGFWLFAKAFLSIVYFVCVLAIYCQFGKSLFPPLFFPFSFLIFEWFIPTYYFKYFRSCSCPSTTRHHLPHILLIMVPTRCSIISQPNRVSTRSHSSLVPVFFALNEHNTSSYYSIDCCSGFHRVCSDCTIFFLFHIYLLRATSFRLSTHMAFTYFPSSFFVISLFQKASPVNVNYVTTVSSSSPSTPLWSSNHPPSTPDLDKTIPLPSPLQQSLDQYIAVHRREAS